MRLRDFDESHAFSFRNNALFSEDIRERDVITQVPNRLALVINGATGEKYLIKTLDYMFGR